MPKLLTWGLLVFWIVVAYREYQRGDMMLAVVFLVAGIALTAYRLKRATATKPPDQSNA